MFLAVGIVCSAFGQKQDKTYKETFNVNKDVIVEINASNNDIEVTTWNKNQVQVEATIEIEGLTKEEAAKYFKNYKFEALGNSKRVVITSKGSGFYGLNNNFVIFNKDDFHFPEVVIPDMDFDFNFPEMETIVIPDIDLQNVFKGLENMEFDFDKYSKDGKNYFFQWKDSARNISIKSKKEWEKFKKSKEYKEWKKEMKVNAAKIKKDLAKARLELKKVNKETIENAFKEAKIAMSKIDKEKINIELAKVKKAMGKVKGNYFFDSDGDVIINDKKVKIKKKITIKVPKGATFELNTRHCKVKLPNTTAASGKSSYGTFSATGLLGGDLKIYYAPVTINILKNAELSLHNVTDATIASVANATLSSSSGLLKINEIFSDVDLESSFGELTIGKLNSSLSDFNLTLRQSDAKIGKTFFVNNIKYGKYKDTFTGNFTLETKKGGVSINGKYSSLELIK
ncbi:hypothetical protein RQM59_06675 [Flavobacteriaceae bacterium S356]|uniref:Adhesin domain-containing protein n=1 Tax=Asprobacillus argus TaxID=3076534 RepID=A0ABU3LEB8_9FLAO|nr:hypothetical protein [Flavobacteriaceae bacterium S356]